MIFASEIKACTKCTHTHWAIFPYPRALYVVNTREVSDGLFFWFLRPNQLKWVNHSITIDTEIFFFVSDISHDMYIPRNVNLRNAITQKPRTKRISPEELTQSFKGSLQPWWKCHWAPSDGEKMHHFSGSQIGSSKLYSFPSFLPRNIRTLVMVPKGKTGSCGSILSCCKKNIGLDYKT